MYLSSYIKYKFFLLLQFKRATVQNYKTGALEIANYRISKSAWLQEHEHKHVAAVSRRVEHMTSLSVDTAEELQVVNYGIGGHYEPHFDFARVSLPLATLDRRDIMIIHCLSSERGNERVQESRNWKSYCYRSVLCKY